MFSRLAILGFWSKCQINVATLNEVKATADKVLAFKSLYDVVQGKTNVPWYVIGAIDYREEDFNHRGNFKDGGTLHMPTWEEGAIKAIQDQHFDRLPTGSHWDIVTSLMKCEAWNGLGYAQMGMRSPYVWGGTNMQQRGKYTGEHHFDPNAWDNQLGVASIWLALKQFHGVDLAEG